MIEYNQDKTSIVCSTIVSISMLFLRSDVEGHVISLPVNVAWQSDILMSDIVYLQFIYETMFGVLRLPDDSIHEEERNKSLWIENYTSRYFIWELFRDTVCDDIRLRFCIANKNVLWVRYQYVL